MRFRKYINKVDELSYKQMWILILSLFLISIIIRCLFIISPRSSYVAPDELTYLNMAKSLNKYGVLTIHNTTTVNLAILYSIIISPLMSISNPFNRITMIGIFNVLLLSSTIFPVYLLSKKIIKNNSIIILLIINILLLPDMTLSMTFMAENLFYPLCAWLFFLVYNYIIEREFKNKVIYCIMIALICNLLYMTKVVSLYFVIAFCIMVILEITYEKNNKLFKNLALLLIFCLSFFILKKLIYFFIYEKLFGIDTYTTSIKISSFDLSKIAFLFYSCIFNSVCSILAFFYFPIIIPIIKFKKISKDLKSLLIFSLSSLFIAIFTVAYMIDINEAYGTLALRQHLRYYSPILLLFLIIFYYILFELKDVIDNNKIKLRYLVFTFFILEVFYFVFRLFYGVCIDGVLLQYIYLICYKFNSNSILLKVFEMFLKFVITIIILLLSIKYIKNSKNTGKIMIFFIISICILNNYCAISSFKNDYGYYNKNLKNKIKQVKTMDDYFIQKPGNILFITDGYDNEIETYFLHKAYFTTTERMLNLNKENIGIDTKCINCSYPPITYNKFKIDYIITDSSVNIKGMKKIKINGINYYNIYAKSSNLISITKSSVFPTFTDTTRKIDTKCSKIYSNFSLNKDGYYESSTDFSKGNVLVYGPYDYLRKGTYDITYFYDYKGTEANGTQIGSVDVNVDDINSVIKSSPILSGDNKIEITINTPNDYKSVETRMYALKDKIIFKNIVIKKLN